MFASLAGFVCLVLVTFGGTVMEVGVVVSLAVALWLAFVLWRTWLLCQPVKRANPWTLRVAFCALFLLYFFLVLMEMFECLAQITCACGMDCVWCIVARDPGFGVAADSVWQHHQRLVGVLPRRPAQCGPLRACHPAIHPPRSHRQRKPPQRPAVGRSRCQCRWRSK